MNDGIFRSIPQNASTEEKLLISRAYDLIGSAERNGVPCFLPFLNEKQQSAVSSLPHKNCGARLVFYGGYESAERKCAGFFPDFLFYDENYLPEDDFPIKVITARGSGFRSLSHKDFFGSLMALGIKRETIGDISVSDDGFCATIPCLEKTADFLVENFTSAANDKLICEKLDCRDAHFPERKFTQFSDTIPSTRLDAVVAACCNISRESADRLIRAGSVILSHSECTDKARLCREGDNISIRHHGRFVLFEIGDKNKKDRLRVTFRKFI